MNPKGKASPAAGEREVVRLKLPKAATGMPGSVGRRPDGTRRRAAARLYVALAALALA